MRVVEPPRIQFKCRSCGATCEGDKDEFQRVPGVMPPTWRARCAFCHCVDTYHPSALIAHEVGTLMLPVSIRSGGSV